MDKNELLKIAKEARERAYAPYSQFYVGAALLCDDGSVYTGCNIENASFSPTCCAERTAIFKAVSDGKRDFRLYPSSAPPSYRGRARSQYCRLHLFRKSEWAFPSRRDGNRRT